MIMGMVKLPGSSSPTGGTYLDAIPYLPFCLSVCLRSSAPTTATQPCSSSSISSRTCVHSQDLQRSSGQCISTVADQYRPSSRLSSLAQSCQPPQFCTRSSTLQLAKESLTFRPCDCQDPSFTRFLPSIAPTTVAFQLTGGFVSQDARHDQPRRYSFPNATARSRLRPNDLIEHWALGAVGHWDKVIAWTDSSTTVRRRRRSAALRMQRVLIYLLPLPVMTFQVC